MLRLGLLMGLALIASAAHGQAQESQSGGSEAASSVRPALTPGNIGHIALAARFRTGHPGRATEPPVIQDNTLFLLTPFPHTLYALDLAQPELPVKWRFSPETDGAARGRICCGRGGGGMALAGGRLYLNTLDGETFALDPGHGAVVWRVRSADPSSGETLASAPMPSGGMIVLGNAGDRFGVRGWIAALDARDGRMLWRRYSTGPDGEVGIAPGFRPVLEEDAAADRGITSWPPAAWRQGGGTVPGPILQDPAAGLIFHGTGYPAPWVPDQRQGDNRWTSGLFARDARTGMARWFLPINTHDLYALGATAPSLLLEREWEGRRRQLLVHPDGNGHVYVIDRGSGELLSAEAFAPVNATSGVDRRTATLIRNPDKAVRRGLTTRDICPARPGAVTAASAFLPETGLLYIPSRRLCMDMEARNANYIRGTGFTGANLRLRPAGDDEARGALVGWDLAAARPAWTVPERFPISGGVLALEGGLVLYGTAEGLLKAIDGRTGAELWRFQAASGIVSRPVAFTGPDGRPWLAVLAGSGDGPEAEIDRRDATAADGEANVLRDLPHPADPSSILYLFRLP